ncbi:MAG TPA: cytochrome ubiquinol oxidase subunit I [Streptosporangiaceae bacterium]|nr:cytochrome ubiquinol oxidase subunit I [Streptosporangiaceae bacterium]
MNVDLARIQFAFTSVNHFFFVPVTIGLAFLTALLQTAWHRSGREEYLRPGTDPLAEDVVGPRLVEQQQRQEDHEHGPAGPPGQTISPVTARPSSTVTTR